MAVSTFATWQEAGIDTRGRTYGNVKTRCPKCDAEKRRGGSDTPLSANISEGVWLCHRCGYSGKITDRHWASDIRSEPKQYAKPNVTPTKTILGAARDWLAKRGIDPDLAAEYGVYSSPDGKSLAFPYVKHGEVVHVKYRSVVEKRFWSTKDTELTLYGYDDCVGAETVVVCEGEMDRLAFVQAAIDIAVSVPNGAPAPGSKVGAKLDFLDGCEEIFQSARKVIIATDADEPGRVLANELVRRIGPEKCYRVRFPEGCKDANDVLMRDGVRAVAALVDDARPEPISGIVTGDDLTEKLFELYDNPGDRGLDFGYPRFDEIYRVKEGMMTIVTGHSSHGKSTVFDQLLVRLVDRHGWHVAIFSPEQQPLEKHQAQILEQYSGKPFRDGPMERRMSRDELARAHDWANRHFTYILPETPTIEEILDKAKVLIFRRGIKGLVIDPWNEIEHEFMVREMETQYINRALQQLRNFARVYNIHLWVIAHPTKMDNTERGEEQIPKLQNISGSIHFRNKADFGLTVFRDLATQQDEVDVIVTKSRWMDYAQPGRVRFAFNKVNKQLRELGKIA